MAFMDLTYLYQLTETVYFAVVLREQVWVATW